MRKSLLVVLMTVAVGCSALTNQSNDNSATAALLALAASGNGNGGGGGTTGGGTGNANISSTTPTNGSVLTASSSTIVVNFTSAMNTSSVQSAFSVSDGSGAITGTFSWSNSNQTVTFTPTALTAWKVHTVTITSSAQSASGTSIGSASFSFRIGPFFAANGKYWMSGVATLMTGSNALSYCSGYGMTLPTSQASSDFSVGYTTNSAGVFSPGGLSDYYWSSTEWSANNLYICRIAAGPTLDCASHTNYVSSPLNTYLVRCVL